MLVYRLIWSYSTCVVVYVSVTVNLTGVTGVTVWLQHLCDGVV